MKWLALETSTEHVSVAACDGAREAVREVAGGAQASRTVLPAIEQVLSDVGLALKDVQAIAFGQGPGAFTGLRTACAVAQGLALGANKPLLAFDSLGLVAQSVRQQRPHIKRVLVTLDARMGQVYWGAVEWRSASHDDPQALGHWVHVLPIAVSNPNEVHWPQGWSASDDHTLAAGSWVNAQGEGREHALGPHTWQAARPQAQAMLSLAASAWHRGLALAPEDAAPLYVRNKVAQTTAERMAQSSGAQS